MPKNRRLKRRTAMASLYEQFQAGRMSKDEYESRKRDFDRRRLVGPGQHATYRATTKDWR